MVNQLLAGVHIASGAEAMAFGARLGLNTRILFDVILNSQGTSWYILILTLPNYCEIFHLLRHFCQIFQNGTLLAFSDVSTILVIESKAIHSANSILTSNLYRRMFL